MSQLGRIIACEECRTKLGVSVLRGKVGELLDLYWSDSSSPEGKGYATLQKIHLGIHELTDDQALAMGYFVEDLDTFLLSRRVFDAKVLTTRIAVSLYQPRPVMVVIAGFTEVLRTMEELPKK